MVLKGSSWLPGASMGDPTHDKVMRRGLMGKASQASGVPPGFSWTSTPENQSLPALLCYAFHYSSDINRGLSPHHLFLENFNLELLDNKSPGHNKSVSIQKPL